MAPRVACGPSTSATFPYPTRFGLQGVASSPAPYLFMRNRMHLVQVPVAGGTRTILVNPTDSERSAAAPYFARLEQRYGMLTRRLLSAFHTNVERALADWGISPDAIDYVTFDHLHTQDVRGLFAPGPGGRAYLPNARLLVQRGELDTLASIHPLQAEWYIPECLAGVPADRIVALDGDYAIGAGLALVRTPGHTRGNHSIVVVTDRGAWTISENGICVDAYAPGTSRIRGVARHARDHTASMVILNANTREEFARSSTPPRWCSRRRSPIRCPIGPELPRMALSRRLRARQPRAGARTRADVHTRCDHVRRDREARLRGGVVTAAALRA